MKVLVKARDVLFLCSLATLASCGDGGGPNEGPAAEVARDLERPAATAEQLRAAQLLSLSGGAPALERSDYAGSVKCAAALSLLMTSIENSPLIDDAQIDALRQAQDLFRTRASEAGAAEGKAPREVSTDLERATDEARDDSPTSSRTAVGCIRSLAGEAQRVPVAG